MKCMVLGGSGFLGSAVCNTLAQHGAAVTSVSRRRAPEDVLATGVRSLQAALPAPGLAGELLAAASPELVVCCIGSPTVGAAQRDPDGEFGASVAAVQAVLEAIRTGHPATRFILVSSAAVYGEGHGRVLDEAAACQPLSFYGHAKLAGETITQAYRTQYNISTLILRPFSVFGPRQGKQVVHDLAVKLLAAPASLTIAGTGDEERDFVHVDDFAALVLRAARGEITVPVLNAGTGVATMLRQLAAGLAARLSPHTEIVFSGETAPGNPVSLVAGTAAVPARLNEGLDGLKALLRDRQKEARA